MNAPPGARGDLASGNQSGAAANGEGAESPVVCESWRARRCSRLSRPGSLQASPEADCWSSGHDGERLKAGRERALSLEEKSTRTGRQTVNWTCKRRGVWRVEAGRAP
jgi:hypothetical protein